ncbi:aminoacyl-tRNA deacylase [Thiohalobacter thiocyanaticus]|nr:YbaK/EbsC family protein [Thiohalobacter thiocyanaticus]
MAMAQHVSRYLTEHEIPYEVLTHPPTMSSLETAASAHIPGDCLAKPVILQDDQGYIMALIPATHRLDLQALDSHLHSHVEMAEEPELAALFEDCELGAMPALGPAYGLRTLVDSHLAEQPDIYFDAGDHECLVHVDGEALFEQMDGIELGEFSHHM